MTEIKPTIRVFKLLQLHKKKQVVLGLKSPHILFSWKSHIAAIVTVMVKYSVITELCV